MKRIATATGQSAIEYLMTYGWMLLVVAVAGGAIFSVTSDQSIESINGFTGGDLSVENFGLNSEGKLDMVLRNTAAENIEVKGVELSQDGETFTTGIDQEVGVGSSEAVSALGAVEESGSNTVDVELTYDTGSLVNLTVEGSVTGNLDVVMSGETETSNWAYVDVSKVSQNVVDTSNMNDFYMMQYEASPSDAGNGDVSGSDSDPSVGAASQQGVSPWADISQIEARDACRASGYDLASNKQWQASTMAEIGDSSTQPIGNNGAEGDTSDGVVDPTDSNRVLTGTGPESWSNELGIYDLNGNVAEWTNTTVDQNDPIQFGGDSDNVDGWNPSYVGPSSLAGSGNSDFGNDYYYSSQWDNIVVDRGGYWRELGSGGTGAGVFSMTLNNFPSDSSTHLGFRCSIS